MISIIIPLYNVEKYIEKCLASIINQTYRDLEIILVDDGSPDNSGLIADEWEKKDNRIKVIHKKNGGLSSARNAGLDICTGEYVMFVDSDDVISENICEVLLDLMKKTYAEIAICDADHVFGIQPHFTSSNEIKVYNYEDAICEMWYQKSFLPSAWGKLYDAKLFKRLRFTEGIIFEDVDIMHEVFYLANKIVYTDAKMYGYMHHEDSITTNPFAQRDLIILDICRKIMDFSKNKSVKLKKAAKAYTITGAMRVYLNAPNQYKKEINYSKNLLSQLGKGVLKDKNIRKKTKYSLILYLYFRPLLKIVYKYVNRWG